MSGQRTSALWVGAVISAALACGSCSKPKPTQIIVRVEAEDDGVGWLGAVTVRIRGTTENMVSQNYTATVRPQGFPMEWGLVPTAENSSSELEITAQGIARNSPTVASVQRARARFVEGRVLRIDLFLFRACTPDREFVCRLASPMGSDQTCGLGGACVPALRADGVALDRDGGTIAFPDVVIGDVVQAPNDSGASEAGAIDSGVAFDSGVPNDSGVSVDTGVAFDSGAPLDSAVPCVPRVVINEVQLRNNAGTDREYVELFNVGACDADLSGWRLVTHQGMVTPTILTFSAGETLSRGAYLVAAHTTTAVMTASRVIRWPDANRFSETAGAVRLERADGSVADRVGWRVTADTTVLPVTFVEGSPVEFTGSVHVVLAREPNGQDTESNSGDFLPNASTSPGLPNP